MKIKRIVMFTVSKNTEETTKFKACGLNFVVKDHSGDLWRYLSNINNPTIYLISERLHVFSFSNNLFEIKIYFLNYIEHFKVFIAKLLKMLCRDVRVR